MDIATIQMLVSNGMLSPNALDKEKNTLLHLALKTTLPLAAKVLDLYKTIPDGASKVVNAQNTDGDTALHIAARQYPKNPIISDLISLGGKTGVPNKKGEKVGFPKATSSAPTSAPKDTPSPPPAEPPMKGGVDPAVSPNFPEYLTVEDEAPRSANSPSFPEFLTVEDDASRRMTDTFSDVTIEIEDTTGTKKSLRPDNQLLNPF